MMYVRGSPSRAEMSQEQWMHDILMRRRAEGTFRELRTPEKDVCFVDFTSNDYLGLGRAADLRQAAEAEARRAREETAERRTRQRPVWTGTNTNTNTNTNNNNSKMVDANASGFPIVGSGGSRLLSGNSWYAEELEDWIARFHKRPSAVLFNSGYDANLGLMSCLPQPGDIVVCDELVHNSVRMGCRMGRQEATVLFHHNDFTHLDKTLRELRARRSGSTPTASPTSPRPSAAGEAATAASSSSSCNIFVAVESVYSMDGDLAPLTDILRVAGAHGASVIVDEAHATGVFGDQGRGLVSALGLEAHPALLAGMHSFGKAFGAHGAVVVGGATLKDFLINYARPLIYSTSLPLDSLACIRCAYLMQASAEDRRRRVLGLADKFQSLLQRVDTIENRTSGGGGGTADSNESDAPPLHPNDVPRHRSPIQSVLVPGNDRSSRVAESLRALGFDVRAIRKPTVAEGTERLRITLHAYNTDLEVESLAGHIRRLAANREGSGSMPSSESAIAAREEMHERSRRDVPGDWTPAASATRARL